MGHILTPAYTVLTRTADLTGAGVLLDNEILLADGHMEQHTQEGLQGGTEKTATCTTLE